MIGVPGKKTSTCNFLLQDQHKRPLLMHYQINMDGH